MIEMKKVRQVFKEYASHYDVTNPRIALKIAHMERTSLVARKIAESLKLSQEDILIAEAVGLLHDIGRFEQLRIYHSFIDYKTVDHADKSCELLFGEQKIREFIEEDTYDTIIQKAIRNHNKFQVETKLDKKELLQVNIIRDADKIDIFEVNVREKEEVKAAEFKNRKEGVTDKVINTFRQRKLIFGPDRETFLDYQIGIIAFIFDLNFIASIKMVKEKQYIEKILDHTTCYQEEDKQVLEEVKRIAIQYIEEKIEEEEACQNKS